MEKSLVGRRILVAEDEYLLAQELVDALTSRGAVIIGPMAQIADAKFAVRSTELDAAILDINLAVGADFALADLLAVLQIPFVFATGYDAGVIPSRHEAVQLFEKPYGIAALCDFLGDALAHSRLKGRPNSSSLRSFADNP